MLEADLRGLQITHDFQQSVTSDGSTGSTPCWKKIFFSKKWGGLFFF